MVTFSVPYVIPLYLPMRVKGRTEAQQRRMLYDRRDGEAGPHVSGSKDIGQAAKSGEKALNELADRDRSDKRGKRDFGNQESLFWYN